MDSNVDPKNEKSNDSQCVLLANYLLKGNDWHCKLPIRRDFGIGYPTSRLANLRSYGLREYIKVRDKMYESKNTNGNKSICKIYYIPTDQLPEAREAIRKNHRKFFERILALED